MAAGGSGAGNGPRTSGAGGGDKKVKGPAPKPTDVVDSCLEETVKAKPTEKAQPQYTDQARSANVEGVVKVEFTLNASGEVSDVRVVQGLGHGLDESAVAAAKRWKFNPATRCGKPVVAKFVVTMRFQLGD